VFDKLGEIVVSKAWSWAQLKQAVAVLEKSPPATHMRVWTKITTTLGKLLTDDRVVGENMPQIADGKELAIQETAVAETLTVNHIFVKIRQWFPQQMKFSPLVDFAMLKSWTVNEARIALAPLSHAALEAKGEGVPGEFIRFVKVRPFNFNDPTSMTQLDWEPADLTPEHTIGERPFALNANDFLAFKDVREAEKVAKRTEESGGGAYVPRGPEVALKIF